MSSVLYVTYDGLLEPLGQSQVLAYLALLASEHRIHVMSFEKKADSSDAGKVRALRGRLHELGIGWTPLRYHKTPSAPATAFDIAVGMLVGSWLALRNRVTIVHARSYVPALIAMPIRFLAGAKLLFDMRGFWADERVDGRLWLASGALYRITKRLERSFLRAADHIVTLTRASARELERFPVLRQWPRPITVIPTCADLARFRPSAGRADDGFVFGYVGSVGTWYLFEETLLFFKALLRRRPDARFLVVNRNEHAPIRSMADRLGIPRETIELVSAAHADVPRFVQRMHLGAALIRPSYSKIASAPTKLAEYLGCGVPCLGNAGVGDVQEILEQEQVGVVMRGFSAADIDAAVDASLLLMADPALGARCAAVARRLFSLDEGVASYRAIYRSLSTELPQGQPHEHRS
ncbi:MAG TPA: glycosyltransferase [Ramlibacter sp.]|uniref:glycosyltransferase n=1 Tax=Ramlibacter sp. TaxID=1917967 RepID=UPI002ED0A0EA